MWIISTLHTCKMYPTNLIVIWGICICFDNIHSSSPTSSVIYPFLFTQLWTIIYKSLKKICVSKYSKVCDFPLVTPSHRLGATLLENSSSTTSLKFFNSSFAKDWLVCPTYSPKVWLRLFLVLCMLYISYICSLTLN